MANKIAQLVINPDRGENFSQIFVSQVALEDEQLLGKLFALAELSGKKSELIKLANFIIDRLTIFYYHNEQLPLLKRLATLTVSDIFESALTKLNQEIPNFLATEKIHLEQGAVNLTVGVLYKNKVYFSSFGHNQALLVYQNSGSGGGSNFNLLNISRQTADPLSEIFDPGKLFTSVISGTIPASSCFLFTNEALAEYLSEKQLIKIVSTLAPAGASEQIRNILEQTNIYVPFCALLIKNQQAESATTLGRPALDPRVSLEPTPVHHHLPVSRFRDDWRQERDLNRESVKTLNRTAEKTAQILRPSGFVNWQKIKAFTARWQLKNWRGQQNKLLLDKKELTWLRRENWLSLAKVGRAAKNFFWLLVKIIIALIDLLRHRERRQALKEKIIGWRRRLTKKHLIILGVSSVCLLAFATSLFFVNSQRREQTKQRAWQAAYDKLTAQEKQLEADMLYDNKRKALLGLEEINNSLSELAANVTPQNIEELKTIQARFRRWQDELSTTTRLTNLEKISGLPAEMSPQSLFWTGDQLILVNKQNKTIVAWRPGQEAATIWQGTDDIKLLNADKQGQVYYLSGRQIISVNPSERQAKVLAITDPPEQISAAHIYNNRLYAIDNNQRQLYRYQLTGSAFNGRSNWLVDNVILPPLTDLAIDSSVYLLADTVLRYDAGAPQAFSLETVYPELKQPSKIIVPLGSDLIYILEPSQKRLLLFSRSGKFLAQYTADIFDNLQDVALDTTGKTAYFLNGQNVYKANLK